MVFICNGAALINGQRTVRLQGNLQDQGRLASGKRTDCAIIGVVATLSAFVQIAMWPIK
jgi:hypothetical protein